VKKEKTGALSGLEQTTAVSPFPSFLTVTRFSKEAKSWAEERAARTRTATNDGTNFDFGDIEPPKQPRPAETSST
jgi:hypothetical protein